MTSDNSYNIVSMACETSAKGQKLEYSEVMGIGGVTTIRNDLFKITLEEAITFLESFKDSVDEKLEILHQINRCKKDVLMKSNTAEINRDENKATMVFEVLQKQLQHWRFGKGGVSLTKSEKR